MDSGELAASIMGFVLIAVLMGVFYLDSKDRIFLGFAVGLLAGAGTFAIYLI